MSLYDILRRQLREDEDERSQPYDDATGIRVRAPIGNVTIGVGRNLDDKPLRPNEIAYLLENDMMDAEADARAVCPSFDALSDNRKVVLCNMALNLGRERMAGFKNMLAAIAAEDFHAAAAHGLDSLWARQVKGRANRLMKMLEDG